MQWPITPRCSKLLQCMEKRPSIPADGLPKKTLARGRKAAAHLNRFRPVIESENLLLDPKVWVVGGDGALGDIRFQNVAKVILQTVRT
jgi:pyruvate/2-oxoacid:ferredoxin oxidoreductase beta subunit